MGFEENNTELEKDKMVRLEDIVFIDVIVDDQDPQVSLLEWNELYLEFEVDFKEPLAVSPGTQQDILTAYIVNTQFFRSIESGWTVEEEDAKFTQKQIIPKQLPEGISEEDLLADAKAQENTFKLIMILQIILTLILKSQKDKLWILISVMQIMVYLPIYKVGIPPNLDIYLSALRNIADFKIIDKQMLMEILRWVGILDQEDQT